jgi:hypothetical protein
VKRFSLEIVNLNVTIIIIIIIIIIKQPFNGGSDCYHLGVMTFVYLFQSDAISLLEKDSEYRDEHFDFIQQHVRKFCLKCIL